MENCGRVIALPLLLVCLVMGRGRADDVVQAQVCNQLLESSMEVINYVLDDIGRHTNGGQDFAGFNFYSTAPKQFYYGRGSCSASMTVLGCSRCINKVISIIKDNCGSRIGGMAGLRAMIYDYFCKLRFEKYSF